MTKILKGTLYLMFIVATSLLRAHTGQVDRKGPEGKYIIHPQKGITTSLVGYLVGDQMHVATVVEVILVRSEDHTQILTFSSGDLRIVPLLESCVEFVVQSDKDQRLYEITGKDKQGVVKYKAPIFIRRESVPPKSPGSPNQKPKQEQPPRDKKPAVPRDSKPVVV